MNAELQTDVVNLAKTLLAIPSQNPPGNEQAIAEFVAGYLETELGLEPTMDTIAPGRLNVSALLSGGKEGLLLNGHLDTVPAGAGWTAAQPWGCVVGSRLYGRGACDMKGAIAAMLVAVKRVIRRDLSFRRELRLLFTADEEDACLGARTIIAQRPDWFRTIAAGVIGEPTSLVVKRLHKGSIHVRITVHGKAAHSSTPEVGRNAIAGAATLIIKLTTLAARLTAKTDLTGHPTLNIGCIKGGSSIYIVPDSCTIDLDRRTLPAESATEVIAEFQEILTNLGYETDLEWHLTSKPLMIEQNTPIVSLLEALTGKPSGAAGFYTEAPIYGELGVPVVLLGPGGIHQAHQPDEYVELDELVQAVHLYEQLITRWCLEDR